MMSILRYGCLFVGLILVTTCVRGQQTTRSAADASPTGVVRSEAPSDPFRSSAIERWEKDIQQIETRDAAEEDPADAILFVGSSSIRRWDTIATDMAPYRTIQRGFGGSKYSDVAVYAERLFHPHQYRALVIFVGNDVAGSSGDRTPDQVERWVRYIVEVSRAHQPDAPVLLIEVTPTEKRFRAWPKIRELNARLRDIALSTAHTYFVATAGQMLDPQGNPRGELFGDDRLHLNADGYQLWAKLIRRRLNEVLRLEQEFAARPASTTES